ncbi:MAG: CRTAC1 family protein [Gemmatimonadetes bacterium]|nr:CRTAC1 family protein [Gemmatimonadota bacterium]
MPFRTIVSLALAAVLLRCGSPDSARPPSSSSAPGESRGAPAGRPPFSDITADGGLDFVHTNGMSGRYYYVEMMGSGGALFDYDADGDLDVYAVQGHPLPRDASQPPPTDRLYRSDFVLGADGARHPRFTDVTEESGIDARGYGMGVATGDYDNDGWTDLYVTNWGPNQLWRNNGDGTFTDVTRETGTDDPRWSAGAAFLDFDLDGWLDLVLVNYVAYTLQTDRPCYNPSGLRDYCGPETYAPERDRLFRNRGDGTFEDVTLRMGLTAAYGRALGVIAADFNLDGWPDIYVANDGQENQLWINRGGRRFEDMAVLAGAAVNAAGLPEASMGVNAADFDGDGDEDIFLTHLNRETNTLYVNLGDALFEDRTDPSGLGLPSYPFTGFGVAPLDYDNDGWLDLLIANGEVRMILEQAQRGVPLPLRQTNQLFRNVGRGRFQEVTPRNDPVFDLAEVSRGIAYGDVDNDGDTDVLVFNNNGPARLLRNDVGQEKPWLGLRLVGTRARRDMLGARVALIRSGAPTLWRRVHSDGSYASAHDPRVLFGLGERAAYEAVRVYWPGRKAETWEGLELNRYHTLAEGHGRPAAVP